MSDEITLADVYHRIGTLEGKMDAVINADARIRSLEQSRSYAYGATGVLSAVVATFVTFLTTKFT